MTVTTRTLALLLALAALALAATGAVAAPAGAKDSPRHGEAKERKCKHRHDGDHDGKHRRRCDHDDEEDGGHGGGTSLPDLTSSIGCDRTTIASGDTFTCTVAIRNDGAAPVTFAPSDIAFLAGLPTGFQILGGVFNGFTTCGTTADWNFCFVDTTTLAPGGSASMTAIVSTPTLTCSDSAVGGDVTITADPTGIVAEADETNNAAGVAITVEPPAC